MTRLLLLNFIFFSPSSSCRTRTVSSIHLCTHDKRKKIELHGNIITTVWINGVEIYPFPLGRLKTSSRAQRHLPGLIVTRSGAFHAFSRAAFSLVMAAGSRSRVSLRLCTSWTEALMAIVSRSCRLAGFSTSTELFFFPSSSFFPSFLLLAFSLIFARTSPSSSHSLESILSRHRLPPLSPPDRKREGCSSSKYSPVVISRKTPFFSPETGEILAYIYIYIYTSIAGARGEEAESEVGG